ncbi:MAG: hypothetical protein ABII76_22845 [Pseudomonadota bacterium]
MLTGPRIIAGRRPLEIVRLIGVSALQGPSYAAGASNLSLVGECEAHRQRYISGATEVIMEATGGARRTRSAGGSSAIVLSSSAEERRARYAGGASAMTISGAAQAVDPWAVAALSRMVSPPVDFIARLDSGARILRAAGVLDLLDVLYICGSYSQASARLNLCSASFALTEVNSPTWTAWASGAAPGGYTGGGAAYLDTGANPSVDFVRATLNSASYGAWAGLDLTTGFSLGDTNNRVSINPRTGGNQISIRVNSPAGLTSAAGTALTAIGLTVGNRPSATLREGWKNGVLIVSDTQAPSSTPTDLFLLRNAATYSANQICAAFAGASMTSAQHLALYGGIGTMLGVPV